MSDAWTIEAPAKINLVLKVLGRRPDRFHEIRTVFQAIDLCDEVEIELGGEGVHLDVFGPDVGPVEDNLAYRAATAFLAETSEQVGGVQIRLDKKIPAAAGLGGGSSDAAAVLRLLGGTVGGVDDFSMVRIASDLGSDVPFFLGNSPLASASGRGELLQPADPLPAQAIVVVTPAVKVSTPEAFDALLAPAIAEGVHPEPRLNAPTSWTHAMVSAENDFQESVAAHHPAVGRALEALTEHGAHLAMLSGSGAACFGIFEDSEAAENGARGIQEDIAIPCYAAQTLTEWPERRERA